MKPSSATLPSPDGRQNDLGVEGGEGSVRQ